MIVNNLQPKVKLPKWPSVALLPCILPLRNIEQSAKTSSKQHPTRKFDLTKYSTFIGTWYGRVYIAKVNKRDSVSAYFSIYSKDSVINMYRDYEFGPNGKMREESDGEILANSMRWPDHVEFTTRQNAREGFFDFYVNDSTLYNYSIVEMNMEPKKEGRIVSESRLYYLIDSTEALNYVRELYFHKGTKREVISIKILFYLMPYLPRKQY